MKVALFESFLAVLASANPLVDVIRPVINQDSVSFW